MQKSVLSIVVGLALMLVGVAGCTPSAQTPVSQLVTIESLLSNTPTLSPAAEPTQRPPNTPTPTSMPTPSATPQPTETAVVSLNLDCLMSAYVADVTVPDNSQFAKGAVFTKTWRIENSGTCDWPADTELAFVSGNNIGATESVAVGAVKTGQMQDVSVSMKAPNEDTALTSLWQLKSNGQAFGTFFSAIIVVGKPVRRVTGRVQWWETPIPGLRVELKQSTDPNSKVIARTTSDKDGQFVFDNPPAGDHAVFVFSADKNYSPFSSRQVNIQAAVDVGPIFLYKIMQPLKPALGSTANITPTLSWPSYSGATNYEWAMFKSIGESSIVPRKTISTSVAITQPLESGVQYCWYVFAKADDIPIASGSSCFTVRP